jgi:hypothetical protein
MSEFSR